MPDLSQASEVPETPDGGASGAPVIEPAPTLELLGATKRYDGKTVLASLDLRIGHGETVGLIGPSGSGKTTILRLALGLLRPDAGLVRFRGAPLDASNVLAARRQMGYVVQDGGLFPHLTAVQNVELMARHLRWEAARIDARRNELVELTRFPPDALERYPAQLSGGQRQRVGLMRALFLDPALLLLDEPLGAIDPLVRAELQDDLSAIFARLDKAVIVVTHDLAEAAFFARRLVLLRQGRIVQEGPIETLLRAPAEPFVTHFVEAQRRLTVTRDGGSL
ncbi:MAG TPA: ATP-binding cassette domain-containing protein [Polyangia bacterium]|nr:ATP-binding cassette domain-containing protein [Polyangia bacterium]